ncbi:MAG TPA: DUF3108 domain-containing protein [Polyangiaceae bacterium]|nr:DUF3108 domain-containing protein [Polyangiaceae bacterium]
MACSTQTPPKPPSAVRVRSEVAWNPPETLPALEQLSAEVRVLGIKAGEFHFEVGRPCDGAGTNAVLRSKMSTAGLVRLFKATDGTSRTTMDLRAGRPLESDLLVLDGDVTRRYQARHRPGAIETTTYRSGGTPEHKVQRLPSGEHALDMQSAFFLLRHWQAEPGAEGYFYVLLGKDLWRVVVTFQGERQVVFRDQPRSVVRMTGAAHRVKREARDADATRRFTIWLSNDAGRTPLFVESDASFGRVLMELTAHEKSFDAPACMAAARL